MSEQWTPEGAAVRLTELGATRYAAMSQRQAVWVNRLADGLSKTRLAATARTLDLLCSRLEAAAAAGGEPAATGAP